MEALMQMMTIEDKYQLDTIALVKDIVVAYQM
jgi:hypothetical protein